MKKKIIIFITILLIFISGVAFYINQYEQIYISHYLNQNCLFSKIVYTYYDEAIVDMSSYQILQPYFKLNIENNNNWQTKEECKKYINWLFYNGKSDYYIESEKRYFLDIDLLNDECYYYFKDLNENLNFEQWLDDCDLARYCAAVYDQDTDLLYVVYVSD